MSTNTEAAGRAPGWLAGIPGFGPGERRPAVIIIVLLLLVLFLLPALLSNFWIKVLTEVAIYSIVALGLNVLMGRVGLVSLGQIAVLVLGAWIGARLLFATGLPFPIVLIMDGLITMVLGILIGLPALRLSGLYLALVTLMLAGAIEIVIAATDFPNGGPGFLGHQEQTQGALDIRRPSIAHTDPSFYRYAVIVAAAMFLLVLLHIRGKPGRAWAAIRQSEPAALAAGVNVTLYKLWAFALAAFITGVAGGLLASLVGVLFNLQFTTSDSIELLAVVLMGGIFSVWGAVIAGAFMRLLPAILDDIGLPPDLLIIIFGVGVLQVLLTAPAGLYDQVPKDLKRLFSFVKRLITRQPSEAPG